MATLSSNKVREFGLDGFNELPVVASDIIYEGSAVGDNGSGYARPLTAGDPFRGFADRKADNSSGSAGDVNVKVRPRGLVKLAISSLAIDDVGKDVYASDDDTFTLTQGSNTRIGYVHRWVSTGYGIIAFDENRGVEAELTDGSTGTASDSIAEITDTATKNAVASLVAKVNYLLRKMGQ